MAIAGNMSDKYGSENNVCYIREWSPLTELVEKIPSKVQSGIFSHYVKFSCIDVLPEYLAIGSSVGIVYWYDRKTKDVQRLRCENANVPVTAVKIISTVDYMVASGSKDGSINIFQIPKSHPDCIPDSLKPKQQKKIERYTVTELHKGEISAIEWSKNGMKLFSGDKNGCIVYTEIDFYMHICKSVEILNEAYEVAQLSYNQQRLLVSTTYRSIICHKLDKWKVCQVGKKDRKLLGHFGGIVYQSGIKPSDSVLYCTRPGLRIWIADIEGNVQKTLLFKDLLNKECPEVPIINPISKTLQALKPQKEPNFGILLHFKENLLVTHNNDIVYILDPQNMCVLYKMSHLRSVLSIATYKDEIFILEEDRNIIRVSDHPEPSPDSILNASTNSSSSPVASIKALTSKLQSTSIISVIPPLLEQAFGSDSISDYKDTNIETNAEEATELSPIVENHHKDKKFDDIGQQDFSDRILFKKSRHRKRHIINTSTNSLSSTSSEEKDASYIRPTIMNLSTVGVLPDLRSPESIKNDIEYKEKILADILKLDPIKIRPDTVNCLDDTAEEKVNKCDKDKKQEETRTKNLSSGTNKDCIKEQKKQKVEKLDKDKSTKVYNLTSSTNEKPVEVQNKQKVGKLDGCYSLNHISKECEEVAQSLPGPSNQSPFHSLTSVNNCDQKLETVKKINDIPACLHIPNDWKLSNIYLNATQENSDSSLNDWELL